MVIIVMFFATASAVGHAGYATVSVKVNNKNYDCSGSLNGSVSAGVRASTTCSGSALRRAGITSVKYDTKSNGYVSGSSTSTSWTFYRYTGTKKGTPSGTTTVYTIAGKVGCKDQVLKLYYLTCDLLMQNLPGNFIAR